MADTSRVAYLLFDVESVADGCLISKIRYAGLGLSPQEAIRRYRDELMAKFDSDFIPYTFQQPISLIVGKVGRDFQLLDLVALDEPRFRSHVITQNFWRGWLHYSKPQLVTFNGRTFDLPLMELSAFRCGICVPEWFVQTGPSWERPRNRFHTDAHLDLLDLLSNFGAVRFSGGLNLAASILGKPGKMDTQGFMVQDLYDQGELVKINDYCRCDVLDTYFVFLRTRVILGQLSIEREIEIVQQTKRWLEARADTCPAYASYLANWGDWQNPWGLESA